MKQKIKIPFALKDGKWVHVSEVRSGLKSNCFCPCCKSHLVAKKGIKITHHFAHHGKASCQPETVLHFIAKIFLLEKIEKHLNNRMPLIIAWPCEKCGKIHEANLLRKTIKVRLEHDLGHCKPDILLLADKDVPVGAIEIIVTHKPEESAQTFYQQQGIALIEFEVKDGKALEMIQGGEALLATRMDQCTSPKCKHCRIPLKENQLIINSAECRRCNRRLKTCYILIAESYTHGPRDFSERQIQIAQQKGVYLKSQFSKTLGREYLANTCPTCQKWVGEHHLHFRIADASLTEKYKIGYHCINCSRDWPCEVTAINNLNDC